MWMTHRLVALVAPLALGVISLTGCQLTQSAFAQSASKAGASFAAAEETLRYAHDGRITTAYAAASFVNYRSELEGLDTQLPSSQGAPNHAQITRLLSLYTRAMAVVEHPCLEGGCDWQGQVDALEAASRAFLKASSA
jgi:hypothetical protein